jgi:hypothetical protein
MTPNNECSGSDGLRTEACLVEATHIKVAARMTRRTVCVLGVGLSTAAFLGLSGAQSLATESHDIRYVLTDLRYAESLEFGAILTGQGSKRLRSPRV